jgi:DNA-binding transcriptional LysR family regulator
LALERQLNVQLFVRSRRNVALTPEGVALVSFARAGGTAAEFSSHIATESAKWEQETKRAGGAQEGQAASVTDNKSGKAS